MQSDPNILDQLNNVFDQLNTILDQLNLSMRHIQNLVPEEFADASMVSHLLSEVDYWINCRKPTPHSRSGDSDPDDEPACYAGYVHKGEEPGKQTPMPIPPKQASRPLYLWASLHDILSNSPVN